MEQLVSRMRRCIEDYNMIEAGDRIAVGLSGGKDSTAMLCALASLRGYYPKPFSLLAVTIELGFPDMDFRPLTELCRRLQVPYRRVRTDIREVVFDARAEKNPCSLCARMRRGALHDAIRAEGVHKIALGHHQDDALETFFLSLLYEGRIASFQPVTYMDRSGVTQIRPMLYAPEQLCSRVVRRLGLPVVPSTCPMDGASRRERVKTLLRQLEREIPDLRAKLFGAMQRLPLPGWAQPEHAGNED